MSTLSRPCWVWTVPLPAETHLLGEVGALGGVIRRHRRVVRRQAPLLAVLLRRHFILRAQMPLQQFEFLPVLQADDVFRRDLTLRRYGRTKRVGGVLARGAGDAQQRRVHLADQRGDVADRHRIVAPRSRRSAQRNSSGPRIWRSPPQTKVVSKWGRNDRENVDIGKRRAPPPGQSSRVVRGVSRSFAGARAARGSTAKRTGPSGSSASIEPST